MLKEALDNGYGLVNGLHEYISDIPDWRNWPHKRELEIIDVRKPKKLKTYILVVRSNRDLPKLAVLGTDCAMGKDYLPVPGAGHEGGGYKAEMIYTGQTGCRVPGTG